MPEAQSETNVTQTIEMVLGIGRRRYWWIVGVGSVVSLVAIGVLLKLPNRYTSAATLVVVQQQVSPRYVEPTMNIPPQEAVKGMQREILSRARMVSLIEEFGLYGKRKGEDISNGLVEILRVNDITIDPIDIGPGGVFNTFRVAFTGDSPAQAQGVTSRLASMFIEENLRSRGAQAQRATSFFSEHLDEVQRKLAEHDRRLRDFKLSNLGELPEQQSSNLSSLADLRMQLASVSASLTQSRQQRGSLETLLGGNISRVAASVSRLESERAALLKTYTERHAQVVKKDQEIAQVKGLLDRMKNGGQGAADATADSSSPEEYSFAQLKGQLDANSTQIEGYVQEEKRLRAGVDEFQKRMNLTPIKEQQLQEYLREGEQLRLEYREILSKQRQSELTASMEEHQEGQHFRLVDPPTLPIGPSSPQRLKFSLGGIGAGIVLGIAIAFLMEIRDRSLHSESELKQQFPLPMVVGVPMILTPAEERIATRKASVSWMIASVLGLVVLAAEFYVYRHG